MTTGRRRPVSKPKGKGGYCWAWKKGHKARGLAAERAGDREKAETHRCHRRPEGDAERCYLHGGTAKTGKDHHSYKHGFYSRRHHGILARAGEAHEALEVMASSHDELAIHKALIDHKLGEVLAARRAAGNSSGSGSRLSRSSRRTSWSSSGSGTRPRRRAGATGPPASRWAADGRVRSGSSTSGSPNVTLN